MRSIKQKEAIPVLRSVTFLVVRGKGLTAIMAIMAIMRHRYDVQLVHVLLLFISCNLLHTRVVRQSYFFHTRSNPRRLGFWPASSSAHR